MNPIVKQKKQKTPWYLTIVSPKATYSLSRADKERQLYYRTNPTYSERMGHVKMGA